MVHTFQGTIIASIILIVLLVLNYKLYRNRLATRAFQLVKQDTAPQVMSMSSFLMMNIVIFVTVLTVIIVSDVTLSASDYVSNCQNAPIGEGPYASCYNGFGKEVYANRKLAQQQIRKDFPELNIEPFSLLNINSRNDFTREQQLLVNSRVFHNIIINTNQDRFILDHGLEVKILKNNLMRNQGVLNSKDAALTVQITNHNIYDMTIDKTNPITIYLSNKLVYPKVVDGFSEVIEAGESIDLNYLFEAINEGYNTYQVRIHGDQYSFRKGQ